MPKKANQIAALPVRQNGNGKLQVLMVTSRDTGRWIVPKGWTMRGKKPWTAAEIEALEEAGATGQVGHDVICNYTYKKRLSKGLAVKCDVDVYPMAVDKLKSNWKERAERKRKWFSFKAAAKRVSEPELAKFLNSVARKPAKQPFLQDLMQAA